MVIEQDLDWADLRPEIEEDPWGVLIRLSAGIVGFITEFCRADKISRRCRFLEATIDSSSAWGLQPRAKLSGPQNNGTSKEICSSATEAQGS